MSKNTKRVAGVVLAAGLSQRMKSRKQLLAIEGEPMVRRAVRTALASNLSHVVVVVGQNDDDVVSALSGLDAVVAEVKNPELGQSESVRAGLARAAMDGCDAVLFMPCDLPLLNFEHLDQLISVYEGGEYCGVASHYNGVLGAPVIIDAALWPEVYELRGDVGARPVITRNAERFASVVWEGGKTDLDTLEDYREYLEKNSNIPQFKS